MVSENVSFDIDKRKTILNTVYGKQFPMIMHMPDKDERG